MSERLEVYKCGACNAMAAVLRGGAGHLSCCGRPMQLYEEKPEEATEDNPLPVNIPTMEHNLNMPVKTVLEIIQRRLTQETTYFGVKAIKNPLDFWVYQEIIFELQPDVIIEVGNLHGGTALAMAHLLDHLGKGRVVGVDIDHEKVPEAVWEHPRITLITGDACASVGTVRGHIVAGDTVLVIEDSSHTYENTLNVVRTYGPLVTPGSYLIVEDTNCHHGLDEGFSPGPYEAVETFIQETDAFEIDRSREAFMITWNPIGFLKKVK